MEFANSFRNVLFKSLLMFVVVPAVGYSVFSKPEQSYLRDVLSRAVTLCPEAESVSQLSMLGTPSFEDIEVDFDSKRDLTLIRAKVVETKPPSHIEQFTLEMGYRFSPPVDQLTYCKLLISRP